MQTKEIQKARNYFWIITLLIFFLNGGKVSAQIPLPYFNNFDSSSTGWTTPNFNPFTQWELGLPSVAPTNTAHSGLSCWDINLHTNYVGPSAAALVSPVFAMGSSPYQIVSFWQNRSTEENFDGMRLEYSIGGSWWDLGSVNEPANANWYTHPDLNFQQHPGWEGNSNGWIKSTYKITNLSNQQVQFQFLFISNGTVNGAGVSVDDFSIEPAPAIDLGITNVDAAEPLNIGTVSDSVTISVKNFGSTTINQFTVSYTYDTIVRTKLCTDVLITGAVVDIKLPGFTVQDTAVLCTSLSVNGDGYLVDNSLCDSVIGNIFHTLPYFNDFESGVADWTTDQATTQTMWQLGLPSYGFTNSTFSGTKCWDINLATAYEIDAHATLTSAIFQLTSSPFHNLSFWQNYYTENNWDGTRLEYSVDGGPWTILGTLNDTNAVNWYTDASLNSTSLPGWEGNSNGWIRSRYRLWGHQNEAIQFRFVFDSDASGNESGVSIDDFSLTDPSATDLGVTNVFVNSVLNIGALSDSVTVLVKNFSTTPASQFTVSYNYNGTIESILYPGILAGNATLAVKLPGFIAITQATLCGNVTISGDIESDNNEFCDTVFGLITYPITYFNDFDVSTTGWVRETNNSQTIWEWGTPTYGSTNSTHSGTSCWDVNLHTAYQSPGITTLTSPGFLVDGNSGIFLSFWLNHSMNSSDAASLYYSNDRVNWTLLGEYNDTLGTNWYTRMGLNGDDHWGYSSGGWKKVTYNTDAFQGDSIIYLRFKFTSSFSGNNNDGVSLDDFEIRETYSNDASITAFLAPDTLLYNPLVTHPVSIKIKNNGINTISNLQLSLLADGVLVSNLSWNNNLPYNHTAIADFTPQVFSPGIHKLTAYISWTADTSHVNDTLSYYIHVLPALTLPYFNTFDSGNDYFIVNTTGNGQTNWENGTPGFPSGLAAHSPPNCWDVNLFTWYTNNARTELITPAFDFSNAAAVSVNFWLNSMCESPFDGLYLEFSTNDSTWTLLGTYNDPMGTNWYDHVSPPFMGPRWSGFSPGWIQVNLNSSQLGGLPYCRIRFVFESDGLFTEYGVSIDDLSCTTNTGLNENEEMKFLLYPNPANDILNLMNMPGELNTVSIIDAEGRVIMNEIINGNQATIDCNLLLPGIYIVKLETIKGRTGYKKFIKH